MMNMMTLRHLVRDSSAAFSSHLSPPFPRPFHRRFLAIPQGCPPEGWSTGRRLWSVSTALLSSCVVVSFHCRIVFMCFHRLPLCPFPVRPTALSCASTAPPCRVPPLHRLVVCFHCTALSCASTAPPCRVLHCTALSCASTASLVPLWCLKRWAAPPEHRTASSSPSRSPTQVTAFPLSCHRLYPGRPLPFFCHATPLLAVSPSSVTAFHCHATASACGVAF